MNKKSYIFVWMVLSINLSAIGQISNKFDVYFNYKTSLSFNEFQTEYLNSDQIRLPTLLGNLEGNRGFRVGIRYSNLNFRYQPGIAIGYNAYLINEKLDMAYRNLKFNSKSILISNKFNFLKYGHYRITPYAKVNGLLNFYKLKFDKSENIFLEEIDRYTRYYSNIEIEATNSTFLLLSLEISLGVEIRIVGRSYLLLEYSLSFTEYPDFDTSSPTLFKEGGLLIGLQYKIKKNKRYYN